MRDFLNSLIAIILAVLAFCIKRRYKMNFICISIVIIFSYIFTARADIASVSFIHNTIRSIYGVDVPAQNGAGLARPTSARYMLSVIDKTNDILNGIPTNTASSPAAVNNIVDTEYARQSIKELIISGGSSYASFCVEYVRTCLVTNGGKIGKSPSFLGYVTDVAADACKELTKKCAEAIGKNTFVTMWTAICYKGDPNNGYAGSANYIHSNCYAYCNGNCPAANPEKGTPACDPNNPIFGLGSGNCNRYNTDGQYIVNGKFGGIKCPANTWSSYGTHANAATICCDYGKKLVNGACVNCAVGEVCGCLDGKSPDGKGACS